MEDIYQRTPYLRESDNASALVDDVLAREQLQIVSSLNLKQVRMMHDTLMQQHNTMVGHANAARDAAEKRAHTIVAMKATLDSLQVELSHARNELKAIDELVGGVSEVVNGKRVVVDTPLVERVRWLKHAAGAEADETARVRGQLRRCQAALIDALATAINLNKGA